MCKECGKPFVSDFTADSVSTSADLSEENRSAMIEEQLKDVKGLKLSVCVGASYDQATNKICFTIPIYGPFCVTSPVKIPVGGEIKVCAETCGSVIPRGLRATVYLNGSSILNVVLFGVC